MAHATDAAGRDGNRGGLLSEAALGRLLALLRAAPETHLGMAEVARMAEAAGLPTTQAELARQLETLVDHGLIGRLFSAAPEQVFDTVTEPHSHMIYEDTAQIVDLHVSPETLLAMLRQTLAERPDGVEILVRVRQSSPPRT